MYFWFFVSRPSGRHSDAPVRNASREIALTCGAPSSAGSAMAFERRLVDSTRCNRATRWLLTLRPRSRQQQMVHRVLTSSREVAMTIVSAVIGRAREGLVNVDDLDLRSGRFSLQRGR